MNRIEIVDLALELIRSLRPIVKKIQLHDPEEARQLKTAANSIVRNASEGWARTGKDKPHLYRVALGSAREVRGVLRLAEAWGWVDEAETAVSHGICDRVLAVLWRMTH